MVTRDHEAPIELLDRMPELVPRLMALADWRAPEDGVITVEDISERATDFNPTEARADRVYGVKHDGGLSATVIVEVQRRRDDMKPRTWPLYMASVWARKGCAVYLLVICPSAKIAAWAGEPIRIGTQMVLQPTAISPESFPKVTDPDDYREDAAIAVFSALLRAKNPDIEEVLEALMTVLAKIPVDQAQGYAGVLDEVLPVQAREILERLMATGTHEFQRMNERIYSRGLSEGEARGEARGELKRQRQMTVALLAIRGIGTPEAVERIESCDDIDALTIWFTRAATATTAEEIFD